MTIIHSWRFHLAKTSAKPDSGHAKDPRNAVGNYSAGNYSAGNYSAGNYSAGNYSAGRYSTRPAKPDRASTSSTSCGTERATHGECTNAACH